MKVKKIGIITYFHFYNYGTMLQAYALLHISKKYGENVDCEIINYKFGEKIIKSYLDLVKIRIKRSIIYLSELNRVLTISLYKNRMAFRKKYFDQFLQNNFKLSTKEYIYKNDLENQPPVYDVYITGSDQTWSPKIGFNSALFLDFAKEDSIKAAYAPSVGVTTFTETEKEYLKKSLLKYDYISCRETIGAELLSKIAGKEVEVVLDPTLMVTVEEWRLLSLKVKIPKRPYILCYFLGHRSCYRHFVKQLKRQTGYDVYFIPVSYKDCKKTNNLLFDVGPAEFLGLIDNAAIICTDSFHGMCFSINFSKNFYGFVKHDGALNGGDNSRIYDLLQRFGLTHRLLSNNDLRNEWKIEPIDYVSVNQFLKKERDSSALFIKHILN